MLGGLTLLEVVRVEAESVNGQVRFGPSTNQRKPGNPYAGTRAVG